MVVVDPGPESYSLRPEELVEVPGGALRQLLTRKAIHFRDPLRGIDYDVQIEGELFALYRHDEPDPQESRRTFQSLSALLLALLLALLASDCQIIPRIDTTPAWLLDARKEKEQAHAQG